MQNIARSRFLLSLAIGLFCLISGPARAASGPGPSEIVGKFDAALLDLMQNAKALGVQGRYQKLEPIVQKSFDLPFMMKLSTGSFWGEATDDQRQKAWRAFGRYITATYASQFDGYSGEQFKLLGEQQIRHGTIVRTQIVKSNGQPVAINYVLHDNDNAWQIRDVYLTGTISQLATRRSEFSATLRSAGMEGLINLLNKKADDLLG